MGTLFGKEGPILAANFGLGGPIFAGDLILHDRPFTKVVVGGGVDVQVNFLWQDHHQPSPTRLAGFISTVA